MSAPVSFAATGLAPAGDALELEADRVAAHVADGSSVALPAAVEQISARPVPARLLDGSTGTPLPPSARAWFETRLGTDLSAVRIHTGTNASRAVDAVDAKAFTVGTDIAFGEGLFAPHTADGRRLLGHELTHVIQQASYPSIAGRVQRQVRGPTPVGGAPAAGAAPAAHGIWCDNERDITTEYRRFAADAPDLVRNAAGIDPAVRHRLLMMIDFVFSDEGAATIENYTVICCSRIGASVLGPGGTASAAIDGANSTMALQRDVAEMMADYRADPTNVDPLVSLLQTVAHEKRHVTLGGAISVAESTLKSRGSNDSGRADGAAYHAEEILSIAEEMAVSTAIYREQYRPSRLVQMRLYRSRNMVRGWVNDTEWQRLRQIIIDQLRNRYGGGDTCDNSFIVGVVSSIDHGEWYVCSNGSVARPPQGLTICTTGVNAFCQRSSPSTTGP